MAKKRKIPIRYQPISTTVNGKIYNGEYYVEHDVVVVRAIGRDSTFRDHRTQLGSSPPESIAKILLREMVEGEQLD